MEEKLYTQELKFFGDIRH